MWDILYDILFQPRVAMATLAKGKQIGQAFAVVLVSIVVPMWALSFGFQDTSMTTMIHVMMGIKIIASMVMWVVGTAIWHFIAEFIGGKGLVSGLFAALGFSHICRMFIIPLWALISVLPASSKSVLMDFALMTILFWSLFLDLMAIKEVYQLSTAKAVLVMIMPLLIMGLLCLLGFIFISSSLMSVNMWG